MPPDFLGVEKQQEQQPQQTTDFLGAKVPIAFSSQPSLPAAGPGAGAGGGASAAPATIGGSGIAPSVPPAPEGFGQLANAALGPEAGGAGVGGGEGGSIGAEGGQGPGSGSPGFSAQFGPLAASVSPAGRVGVSGRTGNSFLDFALAQGLNFGHVPTGVNVPSLIAGILGNPALASAFGLMGLPFEAIALANMIASMSPTSVVSLQAALADPNPEMFASPAVAQAIAEGKQMGPVAGSPMTQGTLGWSPANTATAPRPNDPNDPGATGPPGPGPSPGIASEPAPGEAGAPGPGPASDAGAAASDSGTGGPW